jgi:hypothetical protein
VPKCMVDEALAALVQTVQTMGREIETLRAEVHGR